MMSYKYKNENVFKENEKIAMRIIDILSRSLLVRASDVNPCPCPCP